MIYRVHCLVRFTAALAIASFSALLICGGAHATGALDVSFGSGGRASYALNGGTQSSA